MTSKLINDEIAHALKEVEAVVKAAGNVADYQYFSFHKERYFRMARSMVSLIPKGAAILNIGSHYLHTSLLFKFLGYEVHSMDVEVFWDLNFVNERAKTFELIKIVDNDLENFSSHDGINDKYKAIMFAEILEHITFNPVSFWKKIYAITQPGGVIYISTPNSLNLYNVVRTVARIITFRGVGIPIKSIFSNVTYGHHWKEYSASEIRKYFSLLSDDFKVSTSFYHYRVADYNGVFLAMFSIISAIGNITYFLSDEIEAIVTVNKTSNWKIESPEY
ncbi:MAG: hypothetical protein V4721_00705 [Bacteroidota bacterium]